MPAKKQSIASLNRTLDKLRKTSEGYRTKMYRYQEQLASCRADCMIMQARIETLLTEIKALKHK